MSLEAKIEALTAAVVALTAQLQAGNVAAPAPVAPAPAPVVQARPRGIASAGPDNISAPVVEAPVAAAPAMPAPPTFAAPVAAPVAGGAPFSDGKGLIDYVMGAYKALGPQKGAQIQGVLTSMGYQNINDVKPEHYAALHTGVEALKG
jgi:hypothetical protein